MIRTIIIDDESNAIDTIQNLVSQYCKYITIIDQATNIVDGKAKIVSQKPDLLLLDIAMPGGSGFSLIESLNEINFQLVFITAYSEYAIKAFELSALHYLLKPVSYKSLLEVEERCLKRSLGRVTKKNQLEVLASNINNNDKKLMLQSREKFDIVELDEIVYCESSHNYTIFKTIQGKEIIVSKPLSYYEKLLDEQVFFRIHKSFIVNMKHIKSYQKGRGGLVVMSNLQKIEVSTRRKQDFLTKYKTFTLS